MHQVGHVRRELRVLEGAFHQGHPAVAGTLVGTPGSDLLLGTDGPDTIGRLRSTMVEIPYTWVEDDPYLFGITSSSGIQTTHEIPAAVERVVDVDADVRRPPVRRAGAVGPRVREARDRAGRGIAEQAAGLELHFEGRSARRALLNT